MTPSAVANSRRCRRCERARDFEIVVLEAIADLIAAPVSTITLDDCAEKIAHGFVALNSEQLRQLRERLGEVRRLV